ncbi:unnamed protein product [Moneuplotes crassus]|uniref:Uncharacterized protein n=1 Tax=Euplotes crassus TaxID=5936 RepID=A0AAD1XJW7_EUPCR|nr:unnamed protein product [Moneuplotes crassus]
MSKCSSRVHILDFPFLHRLFVKLCFWVMSFRLKNIWFKPVRMAGVRVNYCLKENRSFFNRNSTYFCICISFIR